MKSKPKAQTHFAVTVIAMIQTHHSYFRQTGPSPANPASRRICGRGTNLANLIAAATFGHRQHSSCSSFAQTNNALCSRCQQRFRNSSSNTASACPPHAGRSATPLCHRGPSAKTHSPGVQTTWWVRVKTVTPARATHPNDCSTKIAGASSRNDCSVTIG